MKNKELKRGPFVFLAIKAIGECDDKGRAILSVEYSGKSIAEKNRPLSLARHVIEMLMPYLRYTSKDAGEKDLKELRDYVNDLSIDVPPLPE